MPKYQSISKVREIPAEEGQRPITVITVSKTELVANWRCAAKLAELEGMHGVAERLRTDANRLEWCNTGDRIEIA